MSVGTQTRGETPWWAAAGGAIAGAGRRTTEVGRDDPGEFGEEIVGRLARRRVHQPRSDPRQLAADGGLDVVFDHGAITVGNQRHGGGAVGEPGGSALALAGDPAAVGGIDLAQSDLALELGLDRTDHGGDIGDKFGVVNPFDGLAARKAPAEDVRVVERRPYGLAGSRDALFAAHAHGYRRSRQSSCVGKIITILKRRDKAAVDRAGRQSRMTWGTKRALSAVTSARSSRMHIPAAWLATSQQPAMG